MSIVKDGFIKLFTVLKCQMTMRGRFFTWRPDLAGRESKLKGDEIRPTAKAFGVVLGGDHSAISLAIRDGRRTRRVRIAIS